MEEPWLQDRVGEGPSEDLFGRYAARRDASDADAEERALVALSLVPGVGPGRIRALLARFGSAAAVLRASPPALAAVPGIGRHTAAALHAFEDDGQVDAQFEQAERVGAQLVPCWDARYPYLLRQTYDPPAFLWLRGTLPPSVDAPPAVAIVGTRRATDYGRGLAYAFAEALAEAGCTVVSGLAYGIDAAAHRGALAAAGCTYAVLGSGVDRLYPARNTRLAEAIMEGGAVLSEYPLGTGPDAPNFPRRNRVVSGLALGTVVVEAHAQGGALITARLAVEQNREVMAVPGAVHQAASSGTNRLIRDGHARLVTTPEEVLEELGLTAPEAPAAQAPAAEAPSNLGPLEQRLYDALSESPQPLDTLCEAAGMDSATALVYLLSLEFKGAVRQMAGKQFYRA